jgi:hypothetical protein
MEDQENYLSPDYQHGFQSGVEKLDKSHFEGYLSNQSNYEWFQSRLAEKKQALSQVDDAIVDTRQKQKTAFDSLQACILGISIKSRTVQVLKEKLETLKADILQLKDRHRRSSSPYSLMAGVLYLLAGLSFVLGDLIISHEIVAYALNIHDNVEAWAFAVGLAMLSVLLKPAYERLIEEPYLSKENPNSKRIHGIFQTCLLFFAVGTMFILGWFRYEAYRTEQLKSGINQQIRTIQSNANPIDPSQASAANSQQVIVQMEQQLKRFDKLNLDLVNSPWALASFVLSGILFAVAGAICLGISFPILQAYWFRWLQASPKLKKLDKAQKVFEAELTTAEMALAEEIIQKNILDNELQSLPKIEDKEAERRELMTDIEELLEEIKLQRIESRISNFNDGYGRGKNSSETMTEEEAEAYRKMMLNQVKNQSDASERPEKNQRVIRTNGLRPHQSLRKAIGEGL